MTMKQRLDAQEEMILDLQQQIDDLRKQLSPSKSVTKQKQVDGAEQFAKDLLFKFFKYGEGNPWFDRDVFTVGDIVTGYQSLEVEGTYELPTLIPKTARDYSHPPINMVVGRLLKSSGMFKSVRLSYYTPCPGVKNGGVYNRTVWILRHQEKYAHLTMPELREVHDSQREVCLKEYEQKLMRTNTVSLDEPVSFM